MNVVPRILLVLFLFSLARSHTVRDIFQALFVFFMPFHPESHSSRSVSLVFGRAQLGDPAAEIAADPPLGVNQPGLLRAAVVR